MRRDGCAHCRRLTWLWGSIPDIQRRGTLADISEISRLENISASFREVQVPVHLHRAVVNHAEHVRGL
jgi:hypothetical protein